VILPAILPELFSSVFLTLGLAWSAVIGAEYVGVESGIGRMIIWAEFFSHTGRMVLITVFIVIYATLSFALVRRITARVLVWTPGSASRTMPIS
jgi:NitT/TauT family transport system permease protein